jgi:bacteriocin biosynthesis cyclodehydratase domain-containing protein
MVIHTGGKKRQHAPAAPAKSDRGNSSQQFKSKDVPQFSPNFSVYVLPPDAVCLYSEDRKFFLHGELYCALADAIGAGKTIGQIERELGKSFPADKIHEALGRLVQRHYIIPKLRPAVASAAAYWTSLGVPTDVAEKNLRQCRVRIQSIGVSGAKELGAALTKLGVRVVKGAADLTIVLASDYLDRRLIELNERHVSDGTPWLLVQPSGIFPLAGPVFAPGESACWMCLAHRMQRNREVKTLLDWREAQCVAASPLARDSLGQSGVALAAVEIAKAIATGFRTELSDHVVSLDLLGSTIAKHYVARRPQCPVCGNKKLINQRRAPTPIELTAGAKSVMTSGGYRTVSSRATVARYRKHVSPLSGVVSRLERMEADLPLNNSFQAMHNFSAPAATVDDLRSGLGGGSFGKGSTSEQGEASALMEAIERYSGIYQGNEITTARRFIDFAPGEAILPNDVLLFSDAQYRRALGSADHTHDVTPMAPPFDPSAKIEWSPVWSLRDQQFKYLPTSFLYFFYNGESAPAGRINADSNGCAAGNTLEEAIVQGFLELIERDSYAIWWYNRLRRPQVDLSQFDDSYIRDLQVQFAATGRRVWMLDITTDLGIPSFVAISHAMEGEREAIEFGSGSHFDARIAALRSLTELNQFLSLGLIGGRDPGSASHDASNPLTLRGHPYLTPNDEPALRLELSSKFGGLDNREQVMACVNLVKQAGLDFLVLDQTRPDIDAPVVRVVVPGLRHFYRRFAPGRLYDVPVKLRWLDRSIAESGLNPVHPHT